MWGYNLGMKCPPMCHVLKVYPRVVPLGGRRKLKRRGPGERLLDMKNMP
jgi:hypothetical protein